MKKEYKVYYSGKDFKGEGVYNIEDGSIKVLKGSRLVQNEAPSFRKYYSNSARIKDQLIQMGIIVDYEFIEDYLFDKTFHASSILSSYGIAGNKAWKTIEGKNIDELIGANNNIGIFKNYYKNFTLDRDIKEVENTIDKFNKQFPLEKLPYLKIEEYDKLGSKKTLAYMIEHGTNIVASGFLGNNRNKIFFNVENNKYDCIEHLKNKYPLKDLAELYNMYIESLYEFITEFDPGTYSKDAIGALPRNTNTEILRQYFINHPQSIDKYTFLQNSAFTHWVKEKCSKMC